MKGLLSGVSLSLSLSVVACLSSLPCALPFSDSSPMCWGQIRLYCPGRGAARQRGSQPVLEWPWLSGVSARERAQVVGVLELTLVLLGDKSDHFSLSF